ncbi:hypothetical protein FHX81_7582 [Saccharothrix saharensis]|uniref:Secreted protein n=1 Tax=Saccharothrix saharensis TaxID=571190 RepID=A0A543JQJ0_9PSEU|nr:hypothetical protein [Saccharothrix saharensis]TQM85112.1 hypothetical protein FHX81_7582 [Saccharothrix saharensis]
MTATSRRAAVAALAATALIGLTAGAARADAQPAPTPPIGHGAAARPGPVPAFDFADCPAIPTGADPAQWRCEVLVSTGTIEFGTLAGQSTGAMRLTFAEGQLNGEFAQVFGALRAEPTTVPGGLLGVPAHNPLLRTALRLEYAGFADFLSDGDRMGVQHLKLRVINGLLPRTCTIGDEDDPLVFRPVRTSGPDRISADPPVLRFTIEDTAFAVPSAKGCGGLEGLVDKRFGLPSPAGANSMQLTTLVGLKSYTEL